MEEKFTTVTFKNNPFRRFAGKCALRRMAKLFVRATQRSDAAKKAVLYGLPGVFSASITFEGNSMRLIKEADEFRIMKKSEKSEILLYIDFRDTESIAEVAARETNLNRVFAAGRMTFRGKTRYLAAMMRAFVEGDKATLSEEDYAELYGGEKE